ncbi:MAG TPA: metal-dependent hydrolase [Bryobacteraceae bacterium]|nr:metal-dependent hydrolase [Bryobacteraceae bacterium]
MDPITHTLTGLALSRAGLNRVSQYATPVLCLAANAPDCDIVTAPWGSVAYLHYHRYITHGLVTIPAMALLAVLVVWPFARKHFDWKLAYAVALIGAATHPLLDWMNAYGIRLLLPFSSKWYALSISSLTDYWILGMLLLAAVVPWFSRLVMSEIGARPGTGRGWAIVALCFIALYGTGRYMLHERAMAELEARLYGGLEPLRVAAEPGPLNPLQWRGIVETAPFYEIFDVNLLQEFDPADGRIFYKPEPDPRQAAAAAAARKTPAFRAFLDFSQLPYWRFSDLDQPANGILVELTDLRFGTPVRPGFVASAVVDSAGRVVESGFSYRGRR